MNAPLSITLEQVDIINRSLERLMAIAQIMADCGPEKRPLPDAPATGSIFIVMLVMIEELEKIWEITTPLGQV